MTEETVQPGCEVSKEEYERFKQFVRSRHGRTRGNLATELENAMRQYRLDDRPADALERIESDVAHIKAMMADTGGGEDHPPVAADSHTHTQNGADGSCDDSSTDTSQASQPLEKPSANAPRAQKTAWLVQRVEENHDGIIAQDDLRDIIMEEYGFEDRTLSAYVDRFIDHVDAQEDPRNDDLLVWGDMVEQVEQQMRQQAEQQAQDEEARLDDASH